MVAADERRREVEGEAKKADVVFRTKVVQFLGRSTPIILQNDNGPCPLLAICNVLLLGNNLDLGTNASEVSQAKLLDLVEGRLIDSNSNPQGKDDGYVSNQLQNLSDAIDVLPKLATGIDLNVTFRKIDGFESTRQRVIFDLLGIPLYHGWIVNPQDTDTAQVIGSKSFNEVVLEHRQLIKNFLKNSASQLTNYGLGCLQENVNERELSVFFRNNHLSTMFKFNGELYLLATDQGYINKHDLVWEKLNKVNGDTVFMTSNFKEFKLDAQVNDARNEQNAMTEYLAPLKPPAPTTSTPDSDLQLAIALQKQEYEQQPQRQQQQSSQQAPVNGRPSTGPRFSRGSNASQRYESKSKDKCTMM